MNIIVKKTPAETDAPKPTKIAQPSPFDNRHGAWGKVDRAHSEDNTVDIYLDTGVHLKRVPVSSREWAVSGTDAGKEYNTGERDLPPVNSRVFVMLPTGRYEDCFVLCSGFSTIDQTAPFMAEDCEDIRERLTPGGWHITDNHRTGSHEAASPDGKTRLTIDYDGDEPALRLAVFDQITVEVANNSAVLSFFDTEITAEQGKPILIKNAVGSLGAFVKELLEALAALHTEGSAANHTASAWAAEKITPLVTKWLEIFKE
jgi:hypothetical protein